ncbi:hypothetical protein EON64_10720 [archaeon]|nr:MAG: hypothetical protein EON64_10720 [archaeon]
MSSLLVLGKVFITFAGLMVMVEANIYVDHKAIALAENEQQGLVAALTILLFVLMACEITGPEVLFLIALMIVTLAQIITLSEALSGMQTCIEKNIKNLSTASIMPSCALFHI